MLNRWLFVLITLPLACGFSLAAELDLLEQINRAGEQRMLSQRIAKSYSMVGLNVQPFVAKQELDQAVLRFEANLQYLDAVPERVKPAVGNLQASWQPFRSAARGVPQKASSIWLSHKADEVLLAAEAVVRELQAASSATQLGNSRKVAQAGRQRMLSQRIVKAYLLVSWGDNSDLTREELDAAINEFAGALNTLSQRSDNSKEAARELEEMAQHWEWLRAALAAEGATSYRLIVAEAGEAILQSADRLTQLYARNQ